jgi:hypothetical protein
MNFSVEKKKGTEKVIKYCWAVKDPETILTDLNIWIADTRATVHSTANITFANNWEPDTSNTVFVMGNEKNYQNWKIQRNRKG